MIDVAKVLREIARYPELEEEIIARETQEEILYWPREANVRVELRRLRDVPRVRLSNSGDVASFARSLASRDREVMWAIYLDAKNYVMGVEEVSVGALNQLMTYPRELFKGAILANAAGIIFVHNHPSGDPEPSAEDLKVHERLKEVGRLLGIRLLDFVVVAEKGYTSLT